MLLNDGAGTNMGAKSTQPSRGIETLLNTEIGTDELCAKSTQPSRGIETALIGKKIEAIKEIVAQNVVFVFCIAYIVAFAIHYA